MKTACVSIPSAFWERLEISRYLDEMRPLTVRAELRQAFRMAEPYRAGQHLSLRVRLTLEQVRLVEVYAQHVMTYISARVGHSNSGVYRNARTVLARLDAAAEGLSRVE